MNNNQNNPIPNVLPTMPQMTPINNQAPMQNQNINQMPAQNPNNSDVNLINNQNNKFINFDNNQNEQSLDNLNVDGSYNQLETSKYSNDPKVIQNINETKKNTVPISKELKTVIIIALVLLLFIIVMPMIFEFINDIRFN